ncbi:MAG TPA: IS66 family transposase [Pirellulales bacterium]|nr:IS66 family transposase [Pirellulales bacterium]
MDASKCPGCSERDARIADLERRLAELEARLNTNATNSSLPPSANPLSAAKPVQKKKSKRRRGGQPQHPPHLKQLLPPERVTHVHRFVPDCCTHCRATLPQTAGPDDPEPKRFQTVELPPIAVEVTEYQAHARTCPCCGAVTQATVPAAIRAHSVGPRLTATLSYLTGAQGLSKRGVEEIAETIFGAAIALGTVANLEQEVSAAVAPAHAEALAAVRQADVKFADETSWKLWGKLCWLWAAATTTVAVFVLHGKRSALGLAALLGEDIHGIVHSDRWQVYRQLAAERRQLCWAHLKRDFQKIVDYGGPSAFVGRRGLRLVKELFAAWHAFQAGKVTRQQVQTALAPLQRRLAKALLEGALGDDARVAKFCVNLLELEDALWTFATTAGVEPTNNYMERLLRRAVLWRRRSFGCNSARGCRFVERILTVVQTCRLHQKNSLEYLCSAVHNHRRGLPCPSLLS